MFLFILLTILPIEEHLVYKIKYGPINAGDLTLDLKRDTLGKNIIKCTEKTTGFVSSIFKIDDWYISISDSNFVTEEFEKYIREGKYRKHQHLKIKNGIAQYQKDTVSVIENAKDIINVWFWLRTQKLIPDTGLPENTLIVPLHADKKNHSIKVNVKKEKKNGKIHTIVVPELKGIKAFGADGELIFYYDADMVPVEFKIKFLWGFLHAELKDRQWKE